MSFVKCLEYKCDVEWLRLVSLEKRRLRSVVITLFDYLKEGCSPVGVSLFSQATNSRMRGYSLKLCQGNCRLGIKKNFFTEKVIRHWSKVGLVLRGLFQPK